MCVRGSFGGSHEEGLSCPPPCQLYRSCLGELGRLGCGPFSEGGVLQHCKV